jgi:YegS/Rv2252/BmrU family lipid kinase
VAGQAEGAPRAAILFSNPRSGRGKRWLFDVVDRCPKYGIDLRAVHFNLDPSAVRSAIESAQAEGIEVALAAGGDGTMGAVSSCLRHSNLAMGILPAGTSNDFARSLRIPVDVDGALRVIADGRWTRVDLAETEHGVFCHAAAVGINTEFARAANSVRTRIGRLSYPIAALQVFLHRRRYPIRLKLDSRSECVETYQVAVVNAPVYGGRLNLEVDAANLKDQKLGVVVVDEIEVGAILQAAVRVVQGRPLRVHGVQTFTTTEACIETDEQLGITLDGEVRGTTPCTIRVLPDALKVFVPKEFITENHD